MSVTRAPAIVNNRDWGSGKAFGRVLGNGEKADEIDDTTAEVIRGFGSVYRHTNKDANGAHAAPPLRPVRRRLRRPRPPTQIGLDHAMWPLCSVTRT